MNLDELRNTCNALAVEIDGYLTPEEWDAVQTFAQAMSNNDARQRYNDLREKVMTIFDLEHQEDRIKYISSFPVGSRSLILFFARIALLQSANAVTFVMSAIDAEDQADSPVRTLAEWIERDEGLNANYFGLF